MFRPETYSVVQEHNVIGVTEQHKKRFNKLAKDDKFVVYVSRSRLLDGYGVITGSPFFDGSTIFGTKQKYPHRCGIRFFRTGAKKPAGNNLWYLSVFPSQMKTTPTNLILCKGGFIEISSSDYNDLVDLIENKQ